MASSDPNKNFLNESSGIMSWLTTLDHKRIGIMYMIAVMTFFLFGGIMAMLMRAELFSAGQTIMTSPTYNQVMTLHGAIMVFMVIIPGIPAFLGNFFLPLQIGAKDVAFPRVNLLSWYCLIIGAIVVVSSLLFHGVDTGWTFYTPYSIKTMNGTTLVVAGAFIIGFSSILTGVNFVATVHKLRAPGMSFFRGHWGVVGDDLTSEFDVIVLYANRALVYLVPKKTKTRKEKENFKAQNLELMVYENIKF